MVTFLLKGPGGKWWFKPALVHGAASVKDGLCFKIAFLALAVSTPFLSGEKEDCGEIRVLCFSKLSLTTF